MRKLKNKLQIKKSAKALFFVDFFYKNNYIDASLSTQKVELVDYITPSGGIEMLVVPRLLEAQGLVVGGKAQVTVQISGVDQTSRLRWRVVGLEVDEDTTSAESDGAGMIYRIVFTPKTAGTGRLFAWIPGCTGGHVPLEIDVAVDPQTLVQPVVQPDEASLFLMSFSSNPSQPACNDRMAFSATWRKVREFSHLPQRLEWRVANMKGDVAYDVGTLERVEKTGRHKPSIEFTIPDFEEVLVLRIFAEGNPTPVAERTIIVSVASPPAPSESTALALIPDPPDYLIEDLPPKPVEVVVEVEATPPFPEPRQEVPAKAQPATSMWWWTGMFAVFALSFITGVCGFSLVPRIIDLFRL